MERVKRLFHILGEDRNRLTYTGLVLFNHLAFGVSINIIGACLMDLAQIFGVAIDDASSFPLGLGIGYFIGALAGFLYRYIDRQIILSVLVTLLAVIVAFLPHYGKLWVAIVAMFFMGVGGGAWDGSQTSWIVELWPMYPQIGLQSIQFLYGVGGIIAPLLAAPFVYGKNNVTEDGTPITVEDRVQSLTLPFAVNGLLQISVPILFFVLYFIYPYRKPLGDAKVAHTTIDMSTVPNRIGKLTLGALCLGTYTGMEMNWIGFSTTMFQNVGLKVEAKEAAHIAAVLSATYTTGRLLTAMVSNWIKPDFIALAHFSLIFVSLGTIYFGQNSRPLLYIGSAALGYGFSAMNAAIFAFSERHMKLTDQVCAIYAFSSGIFALLVPGILMLTFKDHPEVLFTIIGGLLCVCFSLFVACKLWIIIDNRRHL